MFLGLSTRPIRQPSSEHLTRRLIPIVALLILLGISMPANAFAQRITTQDAFDRLEEILELRQEDGLLDARDVLPTILVSSRSRYTQSEGWFQVRALSALVTVFGEGSVRACEACSRPRTRVEDGRLEQITGPASLDEIIQLDDRYRGDSTRARTAIWLDETATGVAMRVTDLQSARVVFAQNVDPQLREYSGAARSFRLSAELERRSRGESLTHALFDVAILPGPHVAFEWVEQWGETNNNLTGVALSLFAPVLGIGASYHRVLEWQNVSLGVEGLVSIPTAIARGLANSNADVIDPLLTGVAIARWPLFSKHSNYAGIVTLSTNGQFGVGISLLNTSFIPLLP